MEEGVFGGKSDALREFVREYFEEHENERVAAAVSLYENEQITLGDAARLADVDRWTMRDILREHGVELRLGLVDEDDATYGRESEPNSIHTLAYRFYTSLKGTESWQPVTKNERSWRVT